MTLNENDRDLVEVVIACTNGQIGRNAALEIIEQLDLAGFEIVRKAGPSWVREYEKMLMSDGGPSGANG